METINDLLKALDNKVPASIAKRLDGLSKLNEKLVLAKAENNEAPTEESQEKLDEIIEFITDTQDDLKYDLKELVAKKRDVDAKNRQEAKVKAELEAKGLAEKQANEAKEKEEAEKNKLEEQALNSNEKIETEKKSGIGWGSLLLGGVLLVVTGGAIKYFGSKK